MKKWCQVIRSAPPVTQNHLPKTEDLMLQNALSGNERPDLLTCLLYRACQGKFIFADPLRMSHATLLKLFKGLTFFCLLLTRRRIPCAGHAKRHLNVQKWSEHVVHLTFWLGNVLRATTAYTFSTSQLPKVLRSWCVLRIFDLEMCFTPQQRTLFHLSSGQMLRTPRFSEPTFWTLRRLKPLEKHSGSRLFCFFAHLHLLSSDSFSALIFFLLSSFFFLLSSFFFLLSSSLLFSSLVFSSLLFSSLTLPTSAFHLSILSEVWLLNFLRFYSSIIYVYIYIYTHYISIYVFRWFNRCKYQYWIHLQKHIRVISGKYMQCKEMKCKSNEL